jgi:[acyl-carrier-protein] S-malonyltransferase
MKPAADQLAEVLSGISFKIPSIPVINNVDVVAAESEADIRDALKRQLFSPVRWVETIEKMAADGADQFNECGPGKVLVGLNKRINKTLSSSALLDSTSVEAALS